MKIAIYARVSKALEQNPENQLIELRKYAAAAGHEVEGEYIDEISSKDTRPSKEAVLKKLRLGEIDGVAFYALDRWGRTMSELVLELEEFSQSNKSLISIKEGMDLSTAAGRLMANVLASMANFERDRIRERTMLGLARARAQGKKLGRPRKYPFNASWSEKTTEISKAHHEIRKKAREANIKGKNCALCGTLNKLEIHHLDYLQPNETITLCTNCHYKAHSKRGAANPSTFIEEATLK